MSAEPLAPVGSRRRRLPLHGGMIAGGAITLFVALVALFSFVWTPHDPTLIVIPDKLQPPSAAHWFGTDHFGRDVFSMLMVGARNSIAVALVAVGIGIGAGVPLTICTMRMNGIEARIM